MVFSGFSTEQFRFRIFNRFAKTMRKKIYATHFKYELTVANPSAIFRECSCCHKQTAIEDFLLLHIHLLLQLKLIIGSFECSFPSLICQI